MFKNYEEVEKEFEGRFTTPHTPFTHLGKMFEDVKLFLKSVWQAAYERGREDVKNDYVKWILAGNIKDYKGNTPFNELRERAEVEDLKRWK